MPKLCVFAGTTEGREIAEFLAERSADVTVCVGGEMQKPAMEPEEITPETAGTLAQRLYPLLDEDTIAAIRKGL